MKILHFVTFLCFVLSISAEVYLLSPMGSNCRYNEANRGRTNAKRLFDSQNNNRGGYNVGQVYFYAGSTMYIQWTASNGCGGPNSNCEVILQYTCDDWLRDGTTTNTIRDNEGSDEDKNPKYGRHESYQSYSLCKVRERNKGLFTASQNLGNTQRNTRQNPNGDRFGFECPEERDYYPYWHPTMWRDIAVLTNNAKRCPYYRAESQNVKSRWSCALSPELLTASSNTPIPVPALNQTACEKFCKVVSKTGSNSTTQCGVWTETSSWGISPPDCRENEATRDNHLGNVAGGYPSSYNWTVSGSFLHERCVLRIRYNVSSNDFPGFVGDTLQPGVDYRNNAIKPTNAQITPNTHPSNLSSIYTKYGLSYDQIKNSFTSPTPGFTTGSRGYVYKTNPVVDIFGSLTSNSNNRVVKLQLAIDTSDNARTFEDRSHRFAIRSVPDDLKGKTIHNVQVSGKRGNIVQVFPGTEYNFNPARLIVQKGAYVHFQWTGSNTNPDNNAGQGKAGTDRSNVVLLRSALYSEGQQPTSPLTYGQLGRSYPDRVDNTSFLGFSKADTVRLATISTGYTPNGQFGGNMDELNDAGTYFDLGPRQATSNGIYNYLCTRNNNFSNRDQKATIIVADYAVSYQAVGTQGASQTVGDGNNGFSAGENVFSDFAVVSVATHPSDTPSSFSGSIASQYLELRPVELKLNPDQSIQVKLDYTVDHFGKATLYRADDFYGFEWESVDASFGGGVATGNTNRGGVFVVQTKTNWGAVVGVIFAVLFAIALIVFFVYRKCRKPSTAEKQLADDKKVQKVNLTAAK